MTEQRSDRTQKGWRDSAQLISEEYLFSICDARRSHAKPNQHSMVIASDSVSPKAHSTQRTAIVTTDDTALF